MNTTHLRRFRALLVVLTPLALAPFAVMRDGHSAALSGLLFVISAALLIDNLLESRLHFNLALTLARLSEVRDVPFLAQEAEDLEREAMRLRAAMRH